MCGFVHSNTFQSATDCCRPTRC